MSIYKRGGVYWYDFWFQGERIRATTGLSNRTAAQRAEAIRQAELAEGRAGIRARQATPLFEKFVQDEFLPWAESEHREKPRTYVRYCVSAKALVPFFGKYRLEVISAGLVEIQGVSVSSHYRCRDESGHGGATPDVELCEAPAIHRP